MKLRHLFAALAMLLFPVVSFAQSAPQNCVDANGYICNWATDPTTSVALGNMSGANGQYTTAIGNGAVVNPGDDYGTAIGAWAMVLAPNATALGANSVASNFGGTAVGEGANANGIFASAFGANAYANGNGTIAIGNGASAGSGTYVGPNPDGSITNDGAVAIGGNSVASTPGGVAINGQATNGAVLAIAGQALAPSAAAIFGSATGESALAIAGVVSGTDSIGIGTGSNSVTGSFSVAIGGGANTTGDSSVAVGVTAVASGFGSVAIGAGATATGTGSVAIGNVSTADDNSVVSVGRPSDAAYPNGLFRRIVNLAAGYNANDAVNFSQLSGVASFLGGGAGFDAQGNPIAPMYVLTNPYTAGDYSTVGDAITALDKAISGVKSTPGPQGPAGANGSNGSNGAQGPAGPQGPQGPAGKDGTGNGSDPLAVHYDDTSLKSVTLGRQPNANGNQTANAIGGPVAVHNLADGTAPDDAVNVSQLDEALASANNYTNIKTTQVLNEANAYTDFRVGQLNGRIKRAIAIATAQAQMVATYAGADPSSANRVAVGTGWEGGYGAMAVGYQHVSVESKHRITWNVGASISGGDGSVGGGVGFSW